MNLKIHKVFYWDIGSIVFQIGFFLQVMMVMWAVYFFTEKREKEVFHKRFLFKTFIEEFQLLVTTQIPIPVIICNYDLNQFLLPNNTGIKKLYENELAKGIFEKTNLEEILCSKKNEIWKENEINKISMEIKDKLTNKKSYFELKKVNIKWRKEDAILFVFVDITTSKELDTYKDRLLHSVSHDLRTPLNGIIGMMEVATNSDNVEFIQQKIKIALKTANGLILLVNDLLDFAQISNSKLKFCLSKIKIHDIIDEIFEIFNYKMKMKGIEFIAEYKQIHIDDEISIDESRLKQLLFNLVGNALKFTKNGYIKIIIDKEIIDNIVYLKISIEDTGIGIKEEDQDKLFSLFGRLDQSDQTLNRYGVFFFASFFIQKCLSKISFFKSNLFLEIFEKKLEKQVENQVVYIFLKNMLFCLYIYIFLLLIILSLLFI